MGALLSHGTSSVDGERIEQMGRPVLRCFGEAMIPVIQHRAQRVASCRQIGNLHVDSIEDLRGGGADVMTRRAAGLTSPEKGDQLVERDSHTHRVTDQHNALDD